MKQKTIKLKIFFIVIFLGFFGMTKSSLAATIQAASCEYANVSAAISAASAGDTVVVPAGNCTYSAYVNINKGITVQGAGAGSTIITANGNAAFDSHISSGTVRITGFGFLGSGGSGTNTGLIKIGGVMDVGIFDYARVDHCTFTNTTPLADIVIGEYWTITDTPKVLIDNNTVTKSGGAFFVKILAMYHAWTKPDDYGTDKFVFLEDNDITYTSSNPYWATDTEYGARMVVRYNHFHGTTFTTHDAHTGLRGQRITEAYNNVIDCPLSNCSSLSPMGLRGGTGVFYNNTTSGNYFAFWTNEISWVNMAGDRHCGNLSKVCSHPTFGIASHCNTTPPAWPPFDQFCSGSTTESACSADADCPSGSACVSYDGNEDASGYPCRDQNGTGMDSPAGTITHDPYYVWGNTFNGSPANATDWGYVGTYIAENRDYCNHNPSTACGSKAGWTYTPYDYPHPLRGDSDTTPPAAPSGLSVN